MITAAMEYFDSIEIISIILYSLIILTCLLVALEVIIDARIQRLQARVESLEYRLDDVVKAVLTIKYR